MMLEPQQLMNIFFVMISLFCILVPVIYIMSNWQEIQATRKANCLFWKHPENAKEKISTIDLVKLHVDEPWINLTKNEAVKILGGLGVSEGNIKHLMSEQLLWLKERQLRDIVLSANQHYQENKKRDADRKFAKEFKAEIKRIARERQERDEGYTPPGQTWPYKSLFFLPEKPIKWCYEVKEDKEVDGKPVFTITPFNPDKYIKPEGRTSASLASAVDWDWCKPILGRTAPILEKVAQGGMIIMGCAALFGIMALLDMLGKGG